MKLLLDEMWPASIARQLRQHGHDMVAVVERPELMGQSDVTILAVAWAEDRAVVTDNIRDFRQAAVQELQRGRSHAGLIFTTNRQFPRHNQRTPGRLVSALDDLLRSGIDVTNLEYWLS